MVAGSSEFRSSDWLPLNTGKTVLPLSEKFLFVTSMTPLPSMVQPSSCDPLTEMMLAGLAGGGGAIGVSKSPLVTRLVLSAEVGTASDRAHDREHADEVTYFHRALPEPVGIGSQGIRLHDRLGRPALGSGDD